MTEKNLYHNTQRIGISLVSIVFLYFFLPVFIAVYALAGQKYRPVVFLTAGVLVACWSSLWGLLPIAVSMMTGWVSALVSVKCSKKAAAAMLGITVALNAASVVVFSYSRFYGADLAGILTGHSFPFAGIVSAGSGLCALHSISYSADVFFGKYERERSFIKTACYIAFFPSFICGPVIRYDRIREELSHPVISYDKLAEGIRTLVYGFAEKLVVAAPLLDLWNRISGEKTENLSFASCWIAAAAFSGSLYFDLKAYCDIAKGLGLMAGFSMPDNFNAPFACGGFNELIRRYCITLFEWFRDYVYRPLCPKRKSDSICLPAMLAAISASLLWLGLGGRYFIWGFFFLLIITLEYITRKLLAKINHVVRAIFMNMIFLGSMPLLIFPSSKDALSFIGRMFSFSGLPGDVYIVYVVKNYFIMFIIFVILAFGLARFVKTALNQLNPNIVRIVQPICQTVLLLVATAFLAVSPTQGFMF